MTAIAGGVFLGGLMVWAVIQLAAILADISEGFAQLWLPVIILSAGAYILLK